MSTLQPPRVVGAELPAPQPHGFVRHDDAAFRQQILDIPEAQAVSVTQPEVSVNYAYTPKFGLLGDVMGRLALDGQPS